MRFAILIPARNEQDAIGPTLAELRSCGADQIIVADNGSTDQTASRAAVAGATVVSEPRAGYGRACVAAMRTLDPSIEIVVFMDADGSDDPTFLPRLLDPIFQGEADFVIGSRDGANRQSATLPAHQLWGNRLSTAFLRLLYRVPCTDLGPFRAIRREALTRLRMRHPDYGWTAEMQVKAALAGLRVREIAVPHRARRAGESKVSGTVRGSILAGSKILWTIFRYRFLPPADTPTRS
ncbi:MAG: glycosyltransferase family 2 protein [Acidobacteriota bacterium]|nr:glycosyltransferase family 2 protein [Acidobacteriota bacterium]